MAYYVVGPDGAESGPFELDVLIGWVKEGQLPPSAPVRDVRGGRSTPAGQLVELSPHYAATSYPGQAQKTGSAIVPTGNPDALWGYYLGVASLICFVGLLIAPISIYKAVKGLKAYRANPEIHGLAHVIVAFVLVALSVGLHVTFFVLVSRT
ncbi:MAG TPA: hypothetical protein VNI20_05480 [Fimbriimonadaceae bacterium]|nr:hypothetical protein [Fimbriimonadaceae bacterium]